jgi:hypothetical protein
VHVAATAYVRGFGQRNEVIQRSLSTNEVCELDRKDGAFQSPFGAQM